MTIPDRGGQEAVDSLGMRGNFGFCTPVELNLITKVSFLYSAEAFVLTKNN